MPVAALLRPLCIFAGLAVGLTATAAVASAPVIVIVDADMSRGYAPAAEAIRRGVILAAAEINDGGGILGHRVVVVAHDPTGRSRRGANRAKTFAAIDNLLAVVDARQNSGPHIESDEFHKIGIIHLDPWAAAAAHANGGRDRYMFSVSPDGNATARFMARSALEKGYRKPGLLIEDTEWGRSLETAMIAELAAGRVKPAAVVRFPGGARAMSEFLGTLVDANADVVLLVAEEPEALAVLHTMAVLRPAQRRPIITHWRLADGDFYSKARKALAKVDLAFPQTFSFFDPPFPDRAAKVARAYCKRFPGCRSARKIPVPMATAHAYDMMLMLAQAVREAGSVDRPKVRDALEAIRLHRGLVRDYALPFAPGRQTALSAADFRLAHYARGGAIALEPRVRRRNQADTASIPALSDHRE